MTSPARAAPPRDAVADLAGSPAGRPTAATRLRFEIDGRDWPNRSASRFVSAGGIVFHMQVMGEGPVALLVHGTGASTHSYAGLMPLLAEHFTVVAFDLPGHGFSAALPAHRMTLPGMAEATAALLGTLGLKPAIAIGHSAGAAIVLRLCLDGRIAPGVAVSLAGALTGFRGLAGRVFSPLAKLLAVNPLMPRLFAWRAGDESVLARFVQQTGSRLDARSVALYGRLVRDPDHVGAALSMMAGWDLDPLWRDLRRLATPVLLVGGGRDGMVPADQVFVAAERIPKAETVVLRPLGHLAHEEDPAAVAALILRAACAHGVLDEDRP